MFSPSRRLVLRRWVLRTMLALLVWGAAPGLPRAAQPTPLAGCAPAQPGQVGLLSLYALAYDNRPTSAWDLTPHYATTLQSIVAATVGHPQKLAVVLADLHGSADTHIRLVQNGLITSIIGLPNSSGTLDPTLREYDMADGLTLGRFLRWARQTFPATCANLTYVGHGAPLVPETDLTAVFGPNPAQRAQAGPLPPLPTTIGANPDFTDQHTPVGSPRPYSVLTPYALAQALALGSNGGTLPFEVVDLAMCFAASIEEFYEIAPYTRFITGSPNYAFFDPAGPGQVLAAINPLPLMTAQVMAETTVATYDALLPVSDHPRILVAVDSSRLADVKLAWDNTAAALHVLLTSPTERTATKQLLVAAYMASLKYDLTYCAPSDWDLANPDGLVDLRHFALQLSEQFAGTGVAAWADQTANALMNTTASPMAVIKRYARNDLPWFDPTPNMWVFNGPLPNPAIDDDAAGLSIYADFVGMPITTTTQLSWHAHWYHDDNTVLDNPQPYRFLADGPPGVGWDEVFQEFWDGESTQTATCIPQLPTTRDTAGALVDLTVRPLLRPLSALALEGPIELAAAVGATASAPNVLLRFQVRQNNTLVFSSTVNTGALITGTQRIVASAIWQPTVAGPFKVEIMVDADDRIAELVETNNGALFDSTVGPSLPRPPIIRGLVAERRQLWPTRAISLTLSQDQASLPAVSRLLVQTYQFKPGADPRVQVPLLRGIQSIAAPSLANLTVTLPPTTQPGAVLLYIWAQSSAGWSVNPLILRLNYAPPKAGLANGASHIYRLVATRGEMLQFTTRLETAQDVDLFVWEPYVIGPPTQQSTTFGDDTITLPAAPLTGEYVLLVRGASPSGALYTLSGRRAGEPLRQAQAVAQGGPAFPIRRPLFLDPDAEGPTSSLYLPVLLK
ncbi:MAG: hypothetical protein H0T53_05835 [Herpetosiphonaceae bacterium]|nr:hypothetical protein [Herpetosiphonaceae bacterium]